MLALYAVAFITQAMATFGISPSINEMVWMYGVGTAGPLLSIIYSILMFLAYNTCKTSWTSTTVATRTNALSASA